uniref:Aflatoxin B1 aldehyde reductase member 4 n=1 Tax=Talaromyces marneffei PM1 TaxID=1077442 RepID=A0A093V543_TALMA
MPSTEAPQLVLGLANVGDTSKDPMARYGTPEAVKQLFDAFFNRGYTSLDTARNYPPHAPCTAEPLIGSALKSYNENKPPFTISTKILHRGEHPHAREKIESNITESLTALQLPQVDIEYLHEPDRSTPFEETCEAMNKAYLEGKFRRFGLSNHSPEEIEEVVKICEEKGPAAAGMFSGNYKTKTEVGNRYDTTLPIGQLYTRWYIRPSVISAVDAAVEIASKHGISGHAAALRWVAYHSVLDAKYGDAIVLGASKVEQLQQNMDIVEAGPLPEEVAEAYSGVFSQSTVLIHHDLSVVTNPHQRVIQATNTLDSLPVELKLCILQQLPNLQSIQVLTRASSKYFQTYTQFRSQVLYDLLLRQYNDEVDIPEAVVTMRSEGVIAENTHNRDKIIDLLDYRRRGAKECKTNFRADSFTAHEIMKMMKLHESAIYFMEDYAADLPAPSWWDHKSRKWTSPIVFSHTERARFFRAFYRFQTWCHIFGQPEYGRHFSSVSSSTSSSVGSSFSAGLEAPSENEWADRTFTLEQAWRLIWGTMPPWEIEEVGALLDYFMSKYIQVFQEITTALINGHRPGNSAEDDPVPSAALPDDSAPVGTLPLGTPIHMAYELRGDPWSLAITFRYSMIEIGPYFLYKILQQPYDDRHISVSNNMRSVFTTKLWEVTGINDEQKVPLLSPADRYERADIARHVNLLHVLERPNKSWIRHWAGEEGQLHPDLWLKNGVGHYGSYPTSNRREWKWGYVLWDDERLEEWNAVELSARI